LGKADLSGIWKRPVVYGKGRGVVFLLLLCFLLAGGFASELNASEKKGKAPRKAGLITMNFKDVDLGVLIKFISEITGRNFVVDPAVKGQVTILSPEKVTIDEAYRVFLSVLEVNGFTTVKAGKVIKIIRASEAKGKGVETFFEKGPRGVEDKVITQLYPLKYAAATDLAKLLKPLTAKTGLLIPYQETNTLIVIDVSSNIHRLVRIVDELDVRGVEEIRVFTLEYARAEKLGPKIKEVLQEKGKKRLGKHVLKIIADERTNSLVVLANPKTTTDVQMLIEKLDRRETRPRATIHIYTLENAVAEDLVNVLSEIPGKGAKGKKGKAPLISKEVQISADKATNSLVIIAEPEEYEILEDVIKKLDVPRTMVYVEALIMEVSADRALELGVEWRVGNKYHSGYGTDKRGGVWVGGTAGGGGGLENLASGSLPAGFAAGVVGRAISLGGVTFPSIGAFIKAVRSDSDFNIISTPQILTLDNEEATIEVGQNIPFVTRIDEGTSTTDRAIQSFEYKDVGVTLKVTPQINQNRFVRLKIEESVRNVVESTALGGTVLAPTTTFRTAKTTITVKDNETAVIGGLIEKTMNRSKTQTPCLGNIPVLGWLFKELSDKNVKTNLLVFLTPHIVENPEEGRALYEEKRRQLDREQEKADRRDARGYIRRKGME